MTDKKMNPPNWPFKKLSAHSEWPMHGIVLKFASEVLAVPTTHRKQAAMKMVERCFRMGARLALEFGLDPDDCLVLAQLQLEREIPGAKAALKMVSDDQKQKLVEKLTDAATSASLAELKSELDALAKSKAGNN